MRCSFGEEMTVDRMAPVQSQDLFSADQTLEQTSLIELNHNAKDDSWNVDGVCDDQNADWMDLDCESDLSLLQTCDGQLQPWSSQILS